MPPSNTVELRVVATDEASAVLRSISGTLTNLAGSYISFRGFEDLVKVISDAQLSLLQFQHAYDTFGENVGRTQQQLEDFATTASNTTIFSRDQILKGEAELLKYGELTGDTFDKARQVMLDMASRTGDVSEAAHRLGLVMENPVAGFRLLREVGIALTSEQRQQIQTLVEQGRSLEVANTLLDAYKDRLLDSSEYTKTLSGALEQVKNALKEAFQGAAEGGGPAQLTEALHELRDTFKDPDVKQGLADLATGIVKGAGLAAQSISWFVEHVLVPAGTGLGEIAGAYHETFTEAAAAAAAASGQPTAAAPRPAPGAYTLPDSAASALRPKDYDATGGFRLPAISNQQFLQPSPLAYATPSAGYDEDAVAKILGMPSRQELAKYAAADKATMTELEKAWADYGEKAKAISVDPLITGETRAARLAYWNQEMLKSTQTDLEAIIVADERWMKDLEHQGLALEEHDKRLDEHRTKMLEVTRTTEANAAAALRTQLTTIAGLPGGDQGAGAEAIAKSLATVRDLGAQLLDPLVQAHNQLEDLQGTLQRWHNALTVNVADTKNTKEETAAYAAQLKIVDDYLKLLPEHMHNAATQIGQAQTQLVGALQSSFAGFFANTSEGLRGFVKSFVDAFKQILAQALAMDLIDALGLGGKVGRPSSSGGFTSALLAGIGHLFGMAEGGVLPAGRIAMVGESGTEFLIPQVDTAVVPASKIGGGGTTINYAPVTNISGSGLSAGQLSAVIAVNNRQQREELFRTMERNGLGRMRS